MQLRCDYNYNSLLDHHLFIDIHKLVLIPARTFTVPQKKKKKKARTFTILVSMLARYFGTG